jgi:hypothetical protein
VKRIDVLPDDVLLGVFDFYIKEYPILFAKRHVEAWQSLVHVCRRWRSLVFRSPRRLKLQLYCTPKTPVRDTLDVWPALPLLVWGSMALSSGTDNIIIALGKNNRVREVFLRELADWQLEKVFAAMQLPFSELTELRFFSNGGTSPVIPDSFLGGSAPRLQSFSLSGISFPGLPNLLPSANHLVYLKLFDIPDSGYISPEAMVALLSVLSSLRALYLGFQSPQSRPGLESRSLPPPKRSILPALYEFRFEGITEYLEELVTRIDTPQLDHMRITFFNQIDFDCPRLAQFINCTPKLRALDKAHVKFDDWRSSVGLLARSRTLDIAISCREPDQQLSSVAQVCNSSSPPFSTVEDLYIERRLGYSQQVWKNDAIEGTLWLEVLLTFTAVKNLYLSKEFTPGIAAALRELVGARITEVLPSLQNIVVEGVAPLGSVQEYFGQFVTARQLSGHPVAISVRNEPV